MNSTRLLLAFGLTSLVAACSSDSHPSTVPDGGSDAGESGGRNPGSGGAAATGGSAGRSAGGTANAGGTTTGTGGSSTNTGGAAPGTGGRSSGGAGGSALSDSGVDGNVDSGSASPDSGPAVDAGPAQIEHVFVIAMENHDRSQIVGDVGDAPYINNTVLVDYASASNFQDTLALAIPSEPHYVLVESGTNTFSDVTFTNDDNPSAANSTASTEHLVTQMTAAGVSWMSYQEGLDAATGACPILSDGFYAPKHDPFIFFQDVSGSPPSSTNASCAKHHAAASTLADDLKNDKVANYNFITPNLCNDMHGAQTCPDSNPIRSGDDWLKNNLPAIATYAADHKGVVFIVWDEGSAELNIPFMAIGPTVKKGYVSDVRYTHASVIKSVETIFGLPFLATVKNDNDFKDLFAAGTFP